MIELRTPRLLLRGFRTEDADAMFELDNDPEVRRYLDGMPEPTREGIQATIERVIRTNPEGSERGIWVAELGGENIGWFHLRPARDTGECELGYRLMRKVWRQGIGTEGSLRLLRHAFDAGESHVIARTLVANAPSRGVMIKIGMQPVRDYLYDDRVPAIEYAITREEWLVKAASI